MDKATFVKNLVTLSKLIDVPLEEIVVGGGGWFVLQDLQDTTTDLNVTIPEKYLEALAKREGTYYPYGNIRALLEKWFLPVAVGETTAYIRANNSFYNTQELLVKGEQFADIVDVATVTVLDPLAMLIEKRGSYSALKRSKVKRDQDFEDIQILQDLMTRQSHERLRKAS